MNEQLFWFSLIVGVTLFCVVLAVREGLRQELREQFWREHISKYNKRSERERRLSDRKFMSQAERRRYEYIMKQHNKGDK